MKHQGTYGFTYDSKAEEWGWWAAGCLEHNPARSSAQFYKLVEMAWPALWADTRRADNSRHSPAQPQNTGETGQPTGRRRKRHLWPLNVALIVLLIAQAFWFWG